MTTPSHGSIRNYSALLSNHPSISISCSAITKTNNRFTAENSLISAMAFIMVVATTHFIIVPKESESIREDMKNASDGVKIMMKLLSSSYNKLPLFPLKPQYILSSDDTVMYIYEGKGKESDEFHLVSSKAITQAGTRARYKCEDTNTMQGMRCKLNFTYSAIDCCAPIFVSVCGLTEREMPCEPCINVSVKGLCSRGRVVSAGNRQKGYVMFMRSSNGADHSSYRY